MQQSAKTPISKFLLGKVCKTSRLGKLAAERLTV
jgi:hypothetical protein